MTCSSELLFSDVVIFIFNQRKFQQALEQKQLKLREEEILYFFRALSRTGGMFTTQPVNEIYKHIGFYETNNKGFTISIHSTEDKITKSKKFFYKWELIAKRIIEISPSQCRQLTLF